MCGAHSTWNRNAVVDEIATVPREGPSDPNTDRMNLRARRSSYDPKGVNNTCEVVSHQCIIPWFVFTVISTYLGLDSRLPLLLRPKLRPVVILSDRCSHAQLVPSGTKYLSEPVRK